MSKQVSDAVKKAIGSFDLIGGEAMAAKIETACGAQDMADKAWFGVAADLKHVGILAIMLSDKADEPRRRPDVIAQLQSAIARKLSATQVAALAIDTRVHKLNPQQAQDREFAKSYLRKKLSIIRKHLAAYEKAESEGAAQAVRLKLQAWLVDHLQQALDRIGKEPRPDVSTTDAAAAIRSAREAIRKLPKTVTE